MKYYRETTYPINQYFGADKTAPNMIDFYVNKMGILGHNGHDHTTPNGAPIYCGSEGKSLVEAIFWDYYGGNSLYTIIQDGDKFYRILRYHLKDIVVKVGDIIDSGTLLGHTDNTGEGTTGPHYHFEIKEVVKNEYGNYVSINKDNGYKGAIDPAQFDTGVFILDELKNLQNKVGLLTKLLELFKILLGLLKK